MMNNKKQISEEDIKNFCEKEDLKYKKKKNWFVISKRYLLSEDSIKNLLTTQIWSLKSRDWKNIIIREEKKRLENIAKGKDLIDNINWKAVGATKVMRSIFFKGLKIGIILCWIITGLIWWIS